MHGIVDKSTIKKYVTVFIAIHRKILNPIYSYSVKCFISKTQGAIVWFQFVRDKKSKFDIQYVDTTIAQILATIPQHAFEFGENVNVRFEGTNIIRENDKLLIIKGSNGKEAWSATQAILDAKKEVKDITRALEIAETKGLIG